MPSFRVTMSVGRLRPGVLPQELIPAAATIARRHTTVEASDLAVVSGAARITIRFTADDEAMAVRIAGSVVDGSDALAAILSWRVTRRVGGRWEPVPSE
jgi:hypothetical protein